MNDLDFLGMIEQLRSIMLFMFNSSLFWIITGTFFIFGTIQNISRCFDVSRETNSEDKKKVWYYE